LTGKPGYEKIEVNFETDILVRGKPCDPDDNTDTDNYQDPECSLPLLALKETFDTTDAP